MTATDILAKSSDSVASGISVVADQLQINNDALLQLLIVGGPIVWLLSVISIFSFGLILLKFWQFSRLRPEKKKSIQSSLGYWHQGKAEQALSILDNSKPVQSILAKSIEGVVKHADYEVLQQQLRQQANALLHQLRLFLRPLEMVANISPLLGLMGTVIGMIIAFQKMESSGGGQIDPSVLSGGIWQALLTTVAGLAVAIPVAVAHGYFERKVERVSHLINDSVAHILNSHQSTQSQVKSNNHAVG